MYALTPDRSMVTKHRMSSAQTRLSDIKFMSVLKPACAAFIYMLGHECAGVQERAVTRPDLAAALC